MWIKLLLFIQIISKACPYNNNSNYDVILSIQENIYSHELEDIHSNSIPYYINFQQLKKYDTDLKQFENARFDEIKLFYIIWDEIKNISTNIEHMSGFTAVPLVNPKNYTISYTIGYYKGNNFDNFDEFPIVCGLEQCDLGLVFFDRDHTTEKLNYQKIAYTIEQVLLMVVKSSDNKMLLGTIPYHHLEIKLSLCPYINWVSKKDLLKFIPEDHIKNNGYTKDENENSHIVVPFYKKKDNLEIFICGKLIQPTLPDLEIGFNLQSEAADMVIDEIINPVEDDYKCDSSDNINHLYYFGYSENDTNLMSDRRMDYIDMHNITSNHKFHAGQKIYIYNNEKIQESLKNGNDHLRLSVLSSVEEPKCIKTLRQNVAATILPTIGSINSIKYNSKEKIFYRLIKSEDLGQKHKFKCLSIIKGKHKLRLDEFYSRTAIFSIKNEENLNTTYSVNNDEIIFHSRKIDNYGLYRCIESNATRLFKENTISMDKIYYLPNNNFELSFNESFLKDPKQNKIGCPKKYGSIGNLKSMTVDFDENDDKLIYIDNFSISTDMIDVMEKIIIYKIPRDAFGLTIKCTFETPAKTVFYTAKNFLSSNLYGKEGGNKNTIGRDEDIANQDKEISNSWLIGVMIIIIIFCIIFIIVVFLIVRRKRRIRISNNSLSSSISKLSSLSTTDEKGSISMIDSVKKSSIPKSTKDEKESKTETNSTKDSETSTSTYLTDTYYDDLKLLNKE